MSSQVSSIFVCDRCGREQTESVHDRPPARPIGWTTLTRTDREGSLDLCGICRADLGTFTDGGALSSVRRSNELIADASVNDIPF